MKKILFTALLILSLTTTAHAGILDTISNLFKPQSSQVLGATPVLTVPQGGTGWGAVNTGYLLFGNTTLRLGTSSNLFWSEVLSRLTVSGLQSTSSTSTNATTTGTHNIGFLKVNTVPVGTTTAIVCKTVGECQYNTISAAITAGEKDIFVKHGTYAEQITGTAKLKLRAQSLATIIQCNGATQSPCVTTAGLDEIEVTGFTFNEANAAQVGVAFDYSDSALSRFRGNRINNFATSTKGVDTTSETFYNLIVDNTFFNVTTCYELGGSQANANTIDGNRCRPRFGYGGFGAYLSDARGITINAADIEGPAGENNGTTTGIHIDATSREITVINPWIEALGTGMNIASGAARVTVVGGSITSNGTDIVDNGTLSVFLNTSDTGLLFNQLGAFTATRGTTTQATSTNFHVSSLFNFGGDVFDELVGDGLDLSSGDLIFDCSDVEGTGITCSGEDITASLGTAIDTTEITNDTIIIADFADEDWGELTITSNVATIDDSIIESEHFGDDDWGDITIVSNVASVEDDSHAHTGATLSGIDISGDTNLTAGDNLTLTDDDLDLDAILTGLTRVTTTFSSTTDYASFFTASSTNWTGGGLTDCDDDGQAVSYDATTLKFGCGDDDNSGGSGTPDSKWATSTNDKFIHPTNPLTHQVSIGTTTVAYPNSVLTITATSSQPSAPWLISGLNESGTFKFGVTENGYLQIADDNPALDLSETDASEFGGLYMDAGDFHIYAGAGDTVNIDNSLTLANSGTLFMNNSVVNGGFVPDSSGSYDIGNSSAAWFNLYLSTSNCIYFSNKCLIGGELGDSLTLQDPIVGGSGRVGISTTTPRWPLQIASSTTQQLTLSAGITDNHWSFRNAGGIFYLATSSPSTFATSTASAFSINENGKVTIPNLVASRALFTDSTQGLTTTGTVGAIEAAVGSQNILLETEIDGCSELVALLDNETGACNGTSGPVFPDAPTLTGVVIATSMTMSGAFINESGSLEIPNSATATVDAIGEIALDTTTGLNQLLIATSTNASFPAVIPFGIKIPVHYASTTFTGTTTLYYGGGATHPFTIRSVYCRSNTGTALVRIGDGTNWTNAASISSTNASTTLTTNNSFTYGEDVDIQIGTPASSPVTIGCTFEGFYDRL